MVKIVFTKQARNDLKEIRNFIAANSPLNAGRFIEKIIVEIPSLSHRPTRGRKIIETPSIVIRQIIFSGYRVFYRFTDLKVEIISVVHGPRLIENNPGLQQFFSTGE